MNKLLEMKRSLPKLKVGKRVCVREHVVYYTKVVAPIVGPEMATPRTVLVDARAFKMAVQKRDGSRTQGYTSDRRETCLNFSLI